MLFKLGPKMSICFASFDWDIQNTVNIPEMRLMTKRLRVRKIQITCKTTISRKEMIFIYFSCELLLKMFRFLTRQPQRYRLGIQKEHIFFVNILTWVRVFLFRSTV